MIEHRQQANRSVFFYEPIIQEVGGRLDVPAGMVWVFGTAIPVPAYLTPPIAGAFRLLLEQAAGGIDYLFDRTMAGHEVATPIPNLGTPILAWRDFPTDDLHLLRQDAT